MLIDNDSYFLIGQLPFFLSTTGSENPCQPLSGELRNPTSCSCSSVCTGRHPNFSLVPG
ncbi:hypothetical protein MXB_2013 [Myxobolus squamalis]|nr:hypothetical protein MXB_2013 [Myxobolus squamalis]